MTGIPRETLERALEHHQEGRLADAERLYREILRTHPRDFDALHLLGVLCHQAGRDEQSLALLREALEVRCDSADAHCNLSTVLKALDRRAEARGALERALELDPDLPHAWNNLGGLQQLEGRLEDAVQAYRRALGVAPDYADALVNLASALLDQGRLDEALHQARRATLLASGEARPVAVLANVLAALDDQGRLDEAIAAYRQAIALDGRVADFHFNLAGALEKQGRWDDALSSYEAALAIDPQLTYAISQCLYLKRRLGSWQGLQDLAEGFGAGLERGAPGLTPFSFLAERSSPAQQLRCARLWSDRVRAAAAAIDIDAFPPRGRNSRERLRIGYVSSGFYRHPTGYLVAEMLERHDRARFHISAYSTGPDDGSAERERLRAACDDFVDVRGWPHARTAARIHTDEIDILLDLRGYGDGAVTEVFALRPAPIQVNFLAFPATMGAEFVDYIIVDPFVVPPHQQAHFTEHLAHLPDCYQPNDATRMLPDSFPERSECGLPQTGTVYCCFNNSYKITPEIFDIWMSILDAVPGSVLWLLHANPSSSLEANLKREAELRGVAPERLVFMHRQPHREYLGRYRLADLFLDTLPYNAHTTATDALWAGCPVLTCPGETFASRVAGSLLRAAGMPDLITSSMDEYRERAIQLGRDAGVRAELRQRLEANRDSCALFDSARFTRHLESAFETMRDIHARGEPPHAFQVTPIEPRPAG